VPETSQAGEHEVGFVECDVGLLERVSGGPAPCPTLERRPVLLGGQDDELGRVDQRDLR
jgi:hypothetical protein